MSSGETIDAIQLGLSGQVAETFRSIAADPRCPVNVVAIAMASDRPELEGKTLSQAGFNAYITLGDVPLVTMEQARQIEAPVVLSGLRTEDAVGEELKQAEGRWLFTNASPHRMEDYAALYNAYVGGGQLEELHGMSVPGRIVPGGNCLTIQNVVATAELDREIGITSMHVTTLQGWSGGGYTKIPDDIKEPFPRIGDDEDEKIRTEQNKFVGTIKDPADIAITAVARRGSWLRGHRSKLVMEMARETSMEEVLELLEGVRRPKELRGLKYGEGSPKKHPIKLSKRPLLDGTGEEGGLLRIATKLRPMQVVVHVESVSEDGLTVVLEVVGDNLILGAAGSNIMNAIYAQRKGYLG